VSGSTSSRGIAAVVGVGPRLGSAVARKFASEGYTVAILSRDLGMCVTYPLCSRRRRSQSSILYPAVRSCMTATDRYMIFSLSLRAGR
jgi:hypothetical protein